MPTAGAGVAPGMSVGTVASLPFSAGALASGFSPPKLCWGTGGTRGTSLLSASAAVPAGATGTTGGGIAGDMSVVIVVSLHLSVGVAGLRILSA